MAFPALIRLNQHFLSVYPITIYILNNNAIMLLQNLELLHLIRMRKEIIHNFTDTDKRIKPSDYRSPTSKKTANKLNAHIEQSSKE